MAKILPSIFGANLLRLRDEIEFLEQENTEILHVDMMDGNFVMNIAFGANQVAAMKKASKMVFDVHLMLEHPELHLDDVLATGAEMISVHYESTKHIHRLLQRIRQAGRKAGVVLNPGTSEEVLKYLLDDIDYVLIMTINPGTPGQKFIPKSLEKIANLKQMIGDRQIQIEVDGGINADIAGQVAQAGADLIVVGGYLFSDDPSGRYANLRQAIR